MKKISVKSIIILLLLPVIYFLSDILAHIFASCVLFILRLILYKFLPMATTMYVISHQLYNLVHFYMPAVRISYAVMTTILIVELVRYFNHKSKYNGEDR